MKTYFLKNHKWLYSLAVILTISLFLTSCADDNDQVIVEPQPVSATSNEIMAIPFFVETINGNLPENNSDLLFENRTHAPVIAPDGHQVTWGEFSAVQGHISVECRDEGTYYNLRVSNLIPDGVYTIWNVTVKAPGFDPSNTAEMFNITGIGAAGRGDGTDNTLVASPDGTIEISLTSPGGALSMFGNIGNCALTDEFEFHVVGTYHIDGKTYGPDLGPDGTVAEQFGFIFKNDE